MEEIISLGGDTDTNAAIVGGMLGALYGFNKIDLELVKPVVSHVCTRAMEEGGENNRPQHLSVGKHGV